MAKNFVDDKYTHGLTETEKIRLKYRMYISFSNEKAALALVMEILFNAVDECLNLRSPANSIEIEFNENKDTIRIRDNGRGIPTNLLETILTTLNSGSNIDASDKSSMKISTLGRNGVGTIAYQALAHEVQVTSYRGGTENVLRHLTFQEGEKVEDKTIKCSPDVHGLEVIFTPSKKILGRRTRIVWPMVQKVLYDLQFLLKKNISISSVYIDSKEEVHKEKYKIQDFSSIVTARNTKDVTVSKPVYLVIRDDNIIEEVSGESRKRFISMEIAFIYTESPTPYIDSFCNDNNTIENGDHLDGATEAISRYFQTTIKASMSDKEKEKLDIKWEDVQNGLSIAVHLNSNMEHLFTSQTKLRVVNEDLEKIIKGLTQDALKEYFSTHQDEFKTISNVIKLNARARRESEKVRSTVAKEAMSKWEAFKLKSYDPCINKGKEYKELFIVEGDSAKGTLKDARFPEFQALYAIRGVSLNVFKADTTKIMDNEEFKVLIMKIFGCGIGPNFNLSKFPFDKVIIASDADPDGLNIRSLLLGFFIKLLPELVVDGRVFIAEPPRFRVKDKKNPFVVNKEEYNNRYINASVKEYEIGIRSEYYENPDDEKVKYLKKDELREFLIGTEFYLVSIESDALRYKINEHLMETLYQYFGGLVNSEQMTDEEIFDAIDCNKLIQTVNEKFPELIYSDTEKVIKGSIDGRWQSVEISERLIRRGRELIDIFAQYQIYDIVLRNLKDNNRLYLGLRDALQVLKKFKPDIEHTFKGLGENDADDIRTTVMDPNTRVLIQCTIDNISNDQRMFEILRGSSADEAAARKEMIRAYQRDTSYRELMEQIDT
jgi:DNA gyrase subunit B